jgi:hypothetical protein
MARMPGALWRPLPRQLVPMRAYEILCRHTMVGSLWGTDGYFRSPGTGVSSHFGTGGDGTIIQWIDTAYRAGANLDGNDEVISVENADMGPEFAPWNTGSADNVPAYTEAQIEANAKIAAFVYEEHGIAVDVSIPDTKAGRRGCGVHRQGCDPYRVSGGVKWSNAYGKGCPGPRRIAQEPQIKARAKQIAGGQTEKEWWEMPIPQAEIEKVAQRTRQVVADGQLPYGLDSLRRRLESTERKLDRVLELLEASATPTAG